MFSRLKHKDKKHYCISCLPNFTTEEVLSNDKKTMFIDEWMQSSKLRIKNNKIYIL